MRSLFLVLILSLPAAAQPKIVARGTGTASESRQIAIGDWRNYGVEGYTGKLKWDYEAVPAIGRDAKGEPILVYPKAVVEKSDVEFTPVRFIDGKFEKSKVPAGDALVGSVAPGKIVLKAWGQDKDGFPDVIASLEIELVAPRGPPAPPTAPTSSKYFIIVRPNGPPSKEFEQIMALEGWKELRLAGHHVRDYTLENAVGTGPGQLGMKIENGMKLPVVYPGTYSADGKQLNVSLPKPFPTTNDLIRQLYKP